MTSPLRFSLILPTYNRCDVVETTLRKLIDIDYPNDCYEIIVADNSSDGTPEMVRGLQRTTDVAIHLDESDERLPAVKRNRAAERAAHDYVLFLNDDLWVTGDFLGEHARSHREAGRPVAVLGKAVQSPLMPPSPFVEWYEPFAYDEIADRADETVSWSYFWSMNLSFPRRIMAERNLWFHEDWAEIGHEDVELGYRWSSAGYDIVYNPRAWGEHYHPHTIESASRLQGSVGRGLRDLEVLIPEPRLLERYGVLSTRSSPRGLIRGTIRQALFNRVTTPMATRWLASRDHNTPVTRWMYWKVLLHHTNQGYRSAPVRVPVQRSTLSLVEGAT